MLWSNEKIQLFNADCFDVASEIQNNSVDLVYCDLPFGTTNCDWDIPLEFEKMWDFVNRIAKENTPIVFHAQQPFTSELIMSNKKMFRYTWVWEKSKATGFLNSKIRPLVAHEDIIVFCKKKPNYYPQMVDSTPYNKGIRKEQTKNDVYGCFNQVEIKSDGQRYPRSVQYFKTAESEGKTFYKTEKPLSLTEYIIKTYSKENDLVVDFTMGSGKSALVCKKLCRRFIGIEKYQKGFDIAVERLSEN